MTPASPIPAGDREPVALSDTGSNLHGPALSDEVFACFADLAKREAGLHLPPSKAAMVRTRLARRLRALQLPSYEAYCRVLADPEQSAELATMIAALTTNVSSFFREEHHFDMLRDKVLPVLRAKATAGERVRIWSAGCSNGQEPLSIAIILLEAGLPASANVRILATDIDPNVIRHAHAGQYSRAMTSGLSEARRSQFFELVRGVGEETWRTRPALRELVAFRELNLHHDWPMRGRFDVIFCRNVVIYFDQQTQQQLWRRFADILHPDGWLFLGHSERVSESNLHLFASRGVTSYQRTTSAAAPVTPRPL